MLELEGLNYWAIAVAWLITCAVGAFWYSPAGFAKQWTKYTKVDILKIPTNEATQILVFVVFSGLIQVLSLAVIINSLGAVKAVEGLWVGLILWLGLVAATTVGSTLYQRLGWNFWWLNSSYFLIVIIINSVLLSIWN